MSAKPTHPFRILFVCMGNICRSPAGENVLRHLADQRPQSKPVEIDSAGTIDYHTGNPPDARMHRAARARGIPMTGSARQVTVADLDRFDLVLAADRDNLADLQALATNDSQRLKLRLFCTLCTQHPDEEIPDPYYGGDAGFEHVLDLLEDGCTNLLDQIESGTL